MKGEKETAGMEVGGGGAAAAAAAAAVAAAAIDTPSCGHKQVDFAPVVSAVYVPVHSEYR